MKPKIPGSYSQCFRASVSGREEHQRTRSRLARWVAILALVRKALATPASNILSALLWLALLCTSAVQTSAQGGAPLWTNRYDGPAGFGDSAKAIAVDSSGNVFVTGVTIFDEYEGYGPYATVAYSGTGVPLWTNLYGGPTYYDSPANAVAVDSSGNVFVTGYSWGGISAEDYATIKYSSAGVPLWTNRYNGPPGNSEDFGNAVVVDTNGNVIVTGYSLGLGATFHYATIKYSSAGLPLWTNRYNSLGHSYASDMAVDSGGNVFVTGPSYGGATGDFATIKYSSAGVPLWTNRYNGPGNDYDSASAVAVDNSGNVFVTGSSYGGTNTDFDYATIKYSNAGVPLWTNRYDGPGNDYDWATAMAVDGSGNVLVTGRSHGGTNAHYDYATIKYSSAGVALWTNRYNGPGNNEDDAYAVVVDNGGNVFVTGYSYGGTNTYSDYATIAYSSAGVPLWTNRYDGGKTIDSATDVAVDSSGNVFVTGSDADGDYVTIKYSSVLTPPSLSIAPDGSGGLFIHYIGVPYLTYRLQRAVSLAGPWSDVATNTAPASGLIEYHETTPPPSGALYRAVQP